jgi:hypothetical protein
VLVLRVARLSWWAGRGATLTAKIVGTLGLALGSVLPLVCAVDEDDPNSHSNDPEIAVFQRAIEELDDEDLVEGTRDALAELARGFPQRRALPAASRPIHGEYKRFDDCMETLASSPRGREARRDVLIYLSRRLALDPSTAEDIAQQKVLDVCLHHAKSARADLIPYFVTSAKNATMSKYKQDQTRHACLTSYQAQVDARVRSPFSRVDDFLVFTSLMCQLNDEDRLLMQMAADGRTTREIRDRLGLSSEAAVRQRKKRAIAHLAAHVSP